MEERDTKKLLEAKRALETRLQEIDQERNDILKALEHLDSLLIQTGFRTFQTPTASAPPTQTQAQPPTDSITETNDNTEFDNGSMKVTGKDGTNLGTITVEDLKLTFTPSELFEFTTDIPPFQSFLLERVLDNMRKADQDRASNGDLEPQHILEYTLTTEENKIQSLEIINYGGERRLREITSSIRWTLDKMYDKIIEG